MPDIYCTIEQLSRLFGVDYSTMLDIVHADADAHPHIKRFNRYNLADLVSLHRRTNDRLEKYIDMNSKFLNLYQVQEILKDTGANMVYSTVLRKAMKGEVPALKFGDTYRVPEDVLMRYIQDKKITLHRKRRTRNSD